MDDIKIVAAIRFKELDTQTASDLDTLLSYNKNKEEAKRTIISLAMSVGGRQIGEHENDLIVELPLDQAEIIKDIHLRLENELEIITTIGIGDTLEDAKKALEWTIKHRFGTIKVYEPFMNEMKSEDKIDEQHYLSPQEVAISLENKPYHIKKAEEDKEDTKEQKPEYWADDKISLSDEIKEKVINIVKMLKDKKDYLEQLKTTNPELYESVIAVIQSISQMVQYAKQEDADKHNKMTEKVSQHLDEAEKESLDQETAKVLELLTTVQNEKKQEEQKAKKILSTAHENQEHRKVIDEEIEKIREKEKIKEILDNKVKLFDLALKRVTPVAQKHGVDPVFLAHLIMR